MKKRRETDDEELREEIGMKKQVMGGRLRWTGHRENRRGEIDKESIGKRR